jgi:hypothetical protein
VKDLSISDNVYIGNRKVAIKEIYKIPIGTTILFIKIEKDAIKPGIPLHDIIVTPKHEFMINGIRYSAYNIPQGKPINLYVDYIYHIQVNDYTMTSYLDCSGMEADCWGLYSKWPKKINAIKTSKDIKQDHYNRYNRSIPKMILI